MSHQFASLEGEQRAHCSACGTSIPVSEPILVKFQRCYYCGQSHPLGNVWKGRTAAVVAAAACLAVWWARGTL